MLSNFAFNDKKHLRYEKNSTYWSKRLCWLSYP